MSVKIEFKQDVLKMAKVAKALSHQAIDGLLIK